MKTSIDVLLGNLDRLLEEDNQMNKYFNMAGEFMIRWGWKVLDAEAKKAMLKELTPKPVKKSRAKKMVDVGVATVNEDTAQFLTELAGGEKNLRKVFKATGKAMANALKDGYIKASGTYIPPKED